MLVAPSLSDLHACIVELASWIVLGQLQTSKLLHDWHVAKGGLDLCTA